MSLKGGNIMDKKFTVAIGIIILLVLILAYVLFIGPSINGYLVLKQIEAQKVAVNTIIGIVEQQGYVVLGEENKSIILVKYQSPQQEGSNKSFVSGK